MDIIFIEQAKHIRTEYIKCANEIVNLESEIEKFKNELGLIQKDLKSDKKNQDIQSKLVSIEKNMREIEIMFKPHLEKMENLGKDADQLFDKIRERHPSLTTEQIQSELIPHLSKIKF